MYKANKGVAVVAVVVVVVVVVVNSKATLARPTHKSPMAGREILI